MGSKRYLSRLERRAEYFVSPRDEALPRVSLECNPEIPVAPGEEHYLLGAWRLQKGLSVDALACVTARKSWWEKRPLIMTMANRAADIYMGLYSLPTFSHM